MPPVNQTQESERELAVQRHLFFQGTAIVQLDHIDIGPLWELTRSRVDALCRVLSIDICSHRLENHIDALVSRDNLQHALRRRGLTTSEFRDRGPDNYPELDFSSHPLDCLHGKHRIQAARELLPLTRWWVVNIYLDEGPGDWRASVAEYKHNETRESPGEIYINIRRAEDASDDLSRRRWESRLSHCEVDRLKLLKERGNVCAAFDKLLAIPGVVRSGTIISVWKKYLCLHCDDEIIHYLRAIYSFWASVVNDDHMKMQRIDPNTIKTLEGLAPGVSESDRRYMRALESRGKIFQNFSREDRDCMLQKLESHRGRILSLGLFFQDVLFFEIAAKRMRNMVAGRRQIGDSTVREIMGKIFSFPRNGTITVQTSDSDTREMSSDRRTAFDLSYQQVWLKAFRLSSGRLGTGNRPACLQPWTHPYDQRQLARFAMSLGFESRRVHGIINRPVEQESATVDDFVSRQEPTLKRCGIPYVATFQDDRELLFLDRIHVAPKQCERLNSFFILQDIFHCFFGASSEFSSNDSGTNDHGDSSANPASATDGTDSSRGNPANSRPGSRISTLRPQSTSRSSAAAGETAQPTSPFSSPPTASRPVTPPFEGSPADPETSEQAPPNSNPLQRTAQDASLNIMKSILEEEERKLSSFQNSLDDLEREVADQQSIVEKLSQMQTSEELLMKEEIIEWMKSTYTAVDAHRVILDRVKLDLASSSSAIAEQSQRLNSMYRSDESDQHVRIAQGINKAQEVYNEVQDKRQTLETDQDGLQSQLPTSRQALQRILIMVLGLILHNLSNKSLSHSQRIDDIQCMISTLDKNLQASLLQSSNGPQSNDFGLGEIQVSLGQLRETIEQDLLFIMSAQELDPSWISKLEDLRVTTVSNMDCATDRMKSIEESLRKHYIAKTSAQMNEVRQRIDLESLSLVTLEREIGSLQDNLASFIKIVQVHSMFLKENIDGESQATVEELIDKANATNMSTLVTDMKETLQTSSHEINNLMSVHQPDLEHVVERSKIAKEIAEDCATRRIQQSSARQSLESKTRDMQKAQTLMANALQQAASRLQKKAELESAEASRKADVARESPDPEIAQQAAEEAKLAAKRSKSHADNVRTIHTLVDKDTVNHSLRDSVSDYVAQSLVVAQKAESLANEVMQQVVSYKTLYSKVQELSEKSRTYKAKVSYINSKYREREPQGKQNPPVQSVVKQVFNCCSNIYRKEHAIRSEQENWLSMNEATNIRTSLWSFQPMVDEVRSVSIQVTRTSLEFYRFIAQCSETNIENMVAGMKEKEASIINAMQGPRQEQWLHNIRGIEAAHKAITTEVNSLSHTTATASNHLLLFCKTLLDDESYMQEAREIVVVIQNQLKTAEGSRGEAQSILEKIHNQWPGAAAGSNAGVGVSNNDRPPAAIMNNKPAATSFSTNTGQPASKPVARSDESTRSLVIDIENMASQAEAMQMEYAKCSTDQKQPEKRIADLTELATKAHGISRKLHCISAPDKAIECDLQSAVQASAKVTIIALNLLAMIAKNAADESCHSCAGIKEKLTHAQEAAQKGEKERWENCMKQSQNIADSLDSAISLTELSKRAAEGINSSFERQVAQGERSEEATQSFENMSKHVDTATECKAKAVSVLAEMQVSWWKERAIKKGRVAESGLLEARAMFDRLGTAPKDLREQYEIAETAKRIAEEAYEEAKYALRNCNNSEEEFRDSAERFDLAYQKTMGALKSAEKVLGRRTQRQRTERTQQPQTMTGSPSPNTLHSRSMRHEIRKIYVFIFPSEEKECHFVEPGRSFDKGKELVARGTLQVLDPRSGKIGRITADGFSNNVIQCETVFFLLQGNPQIPISEIAKRARVMKESVLSVD